MAASDVLASGRLLGVEYSKSSPNHELIVRDGTGSEQHIAPGQQLTFPVKLDRDGFVYWWSGEEERLEDMPVIERMKLAFRETDHVQVTRDRNSRDVKWTCYKSAAGVPWGSPSKARPQMAVSSDPFAAKGGPTSSGLAREGSPPQPGEQGMPAQQDSWQLAAETVQTLTGGFIEYIDEAPHRLSLLCFCGGASLILNGIFGVLNVFQVFDHVVYYVVNLYTVFFGLVTCITEAHPQTTPNIHAAVYDVQKWMHEWAKGLTTLWGRGLFHLFQGALAVVSSGSLQVGVVIGSYMIVMGVVYIYYYFRAPSAMAPQEDYIRCT